MRNLKTFLEESNPKELDEAVITVPVIITAILTFAGKVAVDLVAPHAALAITIWWMLPVSIGVASKLAITINVAAWAMPTFIAAIGAGASIKVALKSTHTKIRNKIDGMTPEEMKKLSAKSSDKKLITKTVKDRKFMAATKKAEKIK